MLDWTNLWNLSCLSSVEQQMLSSFPTLEPSPKSILQNLERAKYQRSRVIQARAVTLYKSRLIVEKHELLLLLRTVGTSSDFTSL